MTYGNFNVLFRRTVADKVLYDKVFNIPKNPKYDGCQRGLASMDYQCFNKNTSGGAIKSETMLKQQLTEELHKPIISKFEK